MSYYRSSSKQPTSSRRTSLVHDSAYRETILAGSHSLKFMGKGVEETIEFVYNRGETYCLSNRDIVLRNESATHFITFKIQSNNPSHYKVHPAQAVIAPNKTMEIEIQVRDLELVGEMGRSFFARFLNDKFRICWYSHRGEGGYLGISSNRTSTLGVLMEEKIFKVDVQFKEKSDEEEVRRKPSGLGVLLRERLLEARREVGELQRVIVEREREKGEGGCVNWSVVWVMALLGFLLGVLLPV